MANFHVFHVWEKGMLSCYDTTFFLHFFPFFDFATQLFSIPVTSSNLRSQAPRFLRSSAFYTQPLNLTKNPLIHTV